MQAYIECDGATPVWLFFSVNGSGQFCGAAMMASAVDYRATSTWSGNRRWKALFK